MDTRPDTEISPDDRGDRGACAGDARPDSGARLGGRLGGGDGRDPGSEGRRANLQLGIGGMSCSFCVSSIEKAYRRVPGVEKVSVSLAHQEGLITYDPSVVDETRLRDVMRDIGYTIRDADKLVRYEQEEAELATARNRLAVAGGFTSVIVGLMAVMAVTTVAAPLLAFVIATVAFETVFVAGWHILVLAYTSLRNRILNQHVLLEFGALGAIAGGVGAMIWPDTFTLFEIFGPMTGVAEFFGAATLITSYHLLSGYTSLRLRTRTSQAVRRLLELQPGTARVLRDGDEVEVQVDDVAIGERVRIRPGESVPVDGVVRDGASAVDQSFVTGEPIPKDKTAGDEVVGGSLNQTGTLVIETTTVGEDSFLNQVARHVEEARALKPGILALVDRILAIYVPAVLTVAAASFVFWTLGAWVLFGSQQWSRAIFAALAVGVMGYPCALGMATPLALIRGGAMAAERGILMRSGEAFQVFGELTHLCFDKTGTITEGHPEVVEVVPAADDDSDHDGEGDKSTDGVAHRGDDVLALAAAVDSSSEHPLGRAVVNAARDAGLNLSEATGFESITGQGVRARVGDRRVMVAKPSFTAETTGGLAGLDDRLAQLESVGNTVVAVAAEDRLVGLIAIADPLKADAREAIGRIKALGMSPVMITGDNERTARAVAEQVGIDAVRSQVLPDQKAAAVRELQDRGERVGMVGDGINDAPALTQADVGIAIGAGTDIAIESSDVVVMGDQLNAVPDSYEIAVNSFAKTRQNLVIAFVFNGVGIPAAATGLVSPVFAMIAMVASVTGVLTNSFASRLLRGHDLSSGRERISAELAEHRGTPHRSGHHHQVLGDHHHDQPDRQEIPDRPDHRAQGATGGGPGDSGAAPHHVSLEVADLHCIHCATRIREGLEHTEGVSGSAVDVDTKTVSVDYDPTRTDRTAVTERLRDLGYTPVATGDGR